MEILHTDSIFRVPPGISPNYSRENPLLRLLSLVEKAQFGAEREHYLMEQVQYLFPYEWLELYGPSAPDTDLLDPTRQDNKIDFQKQNVKEFRATDTFVVRGLVTTEDWTGPFLRLSYRGGPDSKLSAAAGHRLLDRIKVWIRINGVTALLPVPYNPLSDRYEIELWGYPGSDLRSRLGAKGRAALDRGELLIRTDLIRGTQSSFGRDGMDDKYMVEVARENSMHPILPLHFEVAWTDNDERVWDSQDGRNYQYEFNMILRGWDHFLGVGISPNPHGGVGFLEYRNLASNYGRYAGSKDLGRSLEWWNFDAFGRKDHGNRREPFLAVDYMDLHILKGNCGIGLHRHRDNQEVFFMMEGQGYMVIGDWCKMPERERCFEIRTLRAGHFAMLKGGNLHALMNPSDEDLQLFMFGGYD